VDERRRRDGTVGDVHRGKDAALGLGRCVAIPRVHLPDGRPGLEPVTDLRMHHDTDGRVDRVALPEPAGSEPDARETDLLRLDRGEETALGSTPAGSSTTRGSPPCASTIARNRSRAAPPSIASAARASAASWSTPRVSSSPRAAKSRVSSRKRPPPSPRRRLIASATSSALPTASPKGWDMSVTAVLAFRSKPEASTRQASASSRASSGVFMKAPEPVLTSSRIRSVPTASFLDITLAAIRGTDGTVAVASRSA